MWPGDYVVSVDDPRDADQAPEHVMHCRGVLDSNHFMAVDNQKRQAYKRNIAGWKPKTPAAYVLRLKT